jgi:hypothetical protein
VEVVGDEKKSGNQDARKANPQVGQKKKKPMAKFNIKEIFTNKKARYGAFSMMISMMAIGLLLFINLIAGQLDIRRDMTSDRRYSISRRSRDIIRNIDQDVTIYVLFQTGRESTLVTQIVEQFAAHSNRISVVYRDPLMNPTFVARYVGETGRPVETGSLIVESGNRYRIINQRQMYFWETDHSQFFPQERMVAINIEPRITNAIEYVLSATTPKVYQIVGHGQVELDESYILRIEDRNFEFATVNIHTNPIPADADALILTTTQWDYSADEAEKIHNYLRNNGRALVMMDRTTRSGEFTNINSLMNQYGVNFQEMAIMEGDPGNFYMQPPWMFPVMRNHGMTRGISSVGLRIIVPAPQNVEIMEERRGSLEIETVLTTSSRAYGKPFTGQQMSPNREPGDYTGPFNIAVAIRDSFFMANENYVTKLVVSGSGQLTDPNFNELVHGANSEFVAAALNWLVDRDAAQMTFISPIRLTTTMLTLDSAQQRDIKIWTMGVIPGVIFLGGLITWLYRRNR